MRDDQAVKGIARPILAKSRDDHVLEALRRHSNIQSLLQDRQGGQRGGAHPADLVEVLQLQHDGWGNDQVGAIDQRTRFVAELLRLPPDEPDDDVGIEEDERSSDHS